MSEEKTLQELLEGYNFKLLPEKNKVPLVKYTVAVDTFDEFLYEFKKGGYYYDAIGGLLPDNVIVIDVDNHDSKETGKRNLIKLADELGLGSLPIDKTFSVATPSGGYHFYFTVPENSGLKSTHIAQELEIKCSPMKVTLPIIGNYTEIGERDILPLPEPWLEYLMNSNRWDYIEGIDFGDMLENHTEDTTIESTPYTDNEVLHFCYRKATDKHGTPQQGHRFPVIQTFAYMANGYGIDLQQVTDYASHWIGGDDTSQKIKSIYDSAQYERGTWEWPNRKNLNNEKDIKKRVKKPEYIYNRASGKTSKEQYITHILSEAYTSKFNGNFWDAGKLLLISPPGTGKTQFGMSLVNQTDFKIDSITYAFATIALGQQKCREAGIHFADGNHLMVEGEKIHGTTYEQIHQFIADNDDDNRNEITGNGLKVLILDEVHTLLDAASYRQVTMQQVLEYIDNFDLVIGMTATPQLEAEIFRDWKTLIINSENEKPQKIIDVVVDKKTTQIDAIEQLMVPGKTNCVMLNDKSMCDDYAEIMRQRGYNATSLHRDNRDGEEGQYLINNNRLPQHYDIIFLTRYYAEGIDLYDVNLGNIIIVHRQGKTPENLMKQFVNRFRDIKPENIYSLRRNTELDVDDIDFDYNFERGEIHKDAQFRAKSWRRKGELYNSTYITLAAMERNAETLQLLKYDKETGKLTVNEYGVDAITLDARQQWCNKNYKYYYRQLAKFGLEVDYNNPLYITADVKSKEQTEREKEIRRENREAKKQKYKNDLEEVYQYYNGEREDEPENQDLKNQFLRFKQKLSKFGKDDGYDITDLIPEIKDMDLNPFFITTYVAYSVLSYSGGKKQYIQEFWRSLELKKYHLKMKDGILKDTEFSNFFNFLILMDVPEHPITGDELFNLVNKNLTKERLPLGIDGVRRPKKLTKNMARKLLKIGFTVKQVRIRENGESVTRFQIVDNNPLQQYFEAPPQ